MDDINPNKFYAFHELAQTAHLRASRETLRRMVKAGRFPAPVRLTAARIAWRGSDLIAWRDRLPTVSYCGEAA